MATTQEKRKAILELFETIIELIQANGEMGISGGELYALLMGSMSLESFQAIMEILVATGRIKRSKFNRHLYVAN